MFYNLFWFISRHPCGKFVFKPARLDNDIPIPLGKQVIEGNGMERDWSLKEVTSAHAGGGL